MQHLSSKGIWALGTLRANRSRNCLLPSEKDLKKGGRGSSTENIDKDKSLVVTSWYDNKRVVLISNFFGKELVGECSRFDRKAKGKVTLERPASVRVYNAYMGGVDKSDMMLALYRTKYRSRKWYQRIAFHLISQCAVNTWIIYREIGGADSYLKFLSEICDVPESVRFDRYDHWPILMDIPNAQRCKMTECKKKTMFKCSKCQVYLCVNKSSCFLDFHGK